MRLRGFARNENITKYYYHKRQSMTKEELHRNVKQFVYQTIMTFKNYSGELNKPLTDQIIQSATRMNARCREACETDIETKAQSDLYQCKNFLEEVIYLLNLLEHKEIQNEINTENIILEAVEIKQIITELCNDTTVQI